TAAQDRGGGEDTAARAARRTARSGGAGQAAREALMHPNAAFEWTDRAEMLAFVGQHSFAHVFTASDAGLFVVHVPVIVRGGRLWFHVARRNRVADKLDGRAVLISVLGREAYQ